MTFFGSGRGVIRFFGDPVLADILQPFANFRSLSVKVTLTGYNPLMNVKLRLLIQRIKGFLGIRKPLPAQVMREYFMMRLRNEFYAPRVAQAAPEFHLEQLAQDGESCGKTIGLKDFKGQNLALVFGSYTCPSFRDHITRLNEIHAELQGQLSFLMIYSEEAHTADGWQVKTNEEQGIVFNRPLTIGARMSIAATFIKHRRIRMPVALDDMDDSTCRRYGGSPERLYLINGEGLIEHQSEPGPFQMIDMEKWYKALKKVCGS